MRSIIESDVRGEDNRIRIFFTTELNILNNNLFKQIYSKKSERVLSMKDLFIAFKLILIGLSFSVFIFIYKYFIYSLAKLIISYF